MVGYFRILSFSYFLFRLCTISSLFNFQGSVGLYPARSLTALSLRSHFRALDYYITPYPLCQYFFLTFFMFVGFVQILFLKKNANCAIFTHSTQTNSQKPTSQQAFYFFRYIVLKFLSIYDILKLM